MKVFVLVGPPGVGKGTQAQMLAEKLSVSHLSTGSVLRAQVAKGTALGKSVKQIIESGALVSDDVLFASLDEELRTLVSSSKDFLLLDGVPRNLSQVTRLDEVLNEFSLTVSKVIFLDAKLEDLVNRLGMRWSCSSCGRVYSFASAPAVDFRCESCETLGSLIRRADDEPEAVTARFGVFLRETAPLIQEYERRGVLDRVNGLQSPEQVFAELKTKFK